MLNWTDPKLIGNDYYFTFKNTSDKKLSPLDAAYYTIDYITKTYPAPYTLYVSGGIDSQAMLYAWNTSGVPFKTFSAVYNQTLNQHDLLTLKEFSKQQSIPISFYDFDLINFLENEHDFYANEYRCGSPQITTFMKLADMTTDGTVIMSGNFILNHRTGGGLPDRNNFSLFYYGVKSNKSFVPFFFIETCELAYAFDLQLPDIAAIHTAGSYTDKVYAFHKYGFPVISQDSKYNGFEEIKKLYDTDPPRMPTARDKMVRLITQTSNRNFDLLYRNKYEAKFFHYKYITMR